MARPPTDTTNGVVRSQANRKYGNSAISLDIVRNFRTVCNVHTVVETVAYLSAAKDAGMSESERRGVVDLLAESPQAGDVMQGTGGCRKVRIAREGGGKSGGYRVITVFGGKDVPVFLLAVFGKGDKDNLTKAERNELAKLTTVLLDSYRQKVTTTRGRK